MASWLLGALEASEFDPDSVEGVLGSGVGSEGAVVEGAVLAGGGVSSLLSHAVNVKASTEAIIKVLLIIYRTPFRRFMAEG